MPGRVSFWGLIVICFPMWSDYSMTAKIVSTFDPLLLIGGANVDKEEYRQAFSICKTLVAADSGADTVLAMGHKPDLVIGDMDSISDEVRAQIPPNQLHRVAEQDSTDFEKCLTRIDAPVILGLGFLGERADHSVASLSALSRLSHIRCILLSPHDLVVVAPPELELSLPIGSRVSLFPMAPGPITGRSTGLKWPIDGLSFAAGGTIGTSNNTIAEDIHLSFDAPGMLLMLPPTALAPLMQGLSAAPARWPVPA